MKNEATLARAYIHFIGFVKLLKEKTDLLSRQEKVNLNSLLRNLIVISSWILHVLHALNFHRRLETQWNRGLFWNLGWVIGVLRRTIFEQENLLHNELCHSLLLFFTKSRIFRYCCRNAPPLLGFSTIQTTKFLAEILCQVIFSFSATF